MELKASALAARLDAAPVADDAAGRILALAVLEAAWIPADADRVVAEARPSEIGDLWARSISRRQSLGDALKDGVVAVEN